MRFILWVMDADTVKIFILRYLHTTNWEVKMDIHLHLN